MYAEMHVLQESFSQRNQLQFTQFQSKQGTDNPKARV